LTAQQTLLLLAVAFPAYIWFVDKRLGRDVLAPVLAMIIVGIVCAMFVHHSPFREGTFSTLVLGGVALGSGVWLYWLWEEGPGLMQRWPQVLLLYLAVLLGLAFYLYEPLASRTNPPMNWGYTQTVDGFFRHLVLGQYEKIHTERTTLQLWGQINILFDGLQQQFNIVYALLALVALFFYRDLAKADRDWMRFLLVAFVFLGVGSIFLLNPTFERQSQFTDRVFFLPAHCVYSIWIGYGLILGLGYLLGHKPGLQTAALPAAIVVLLLPSYSVWRNWADNGQRGHDFGYRFGYRMFKPGGEYPEMDRDAVLLGGTDPGQFIASYMIFVESQAPSSLKTHVPECPESATFDRRDVYIITQNALANASYLESLRDHYGDGRPVNDSAIERWLGRDQAYPQQTLWIPAEKDTELAFQKYVEELRTRAPLPGEEVKVENGHISVQGVLSIMAINGYLARMVFDHNKDNHTFYVEEGYALAWMYPYAEPYGILLRLNKEPTAVLDPAVVARDRAYWDGLFHELDADPNYKHDEVAQRTFSKLRTADGELYAFRRMGDEAEYAFQQAIALCPDSSEANFQLVQLYIGLARYDDASAVLAGYQKLDPYNPQIRQVINAVQNMKAQAGQTRQLEEQYHAAPDNLPVALDLVAAYARARRMDALDSLVDSLSARADLSSNDLLQVASFYAQLNRPDRVELLLSVFIHRFPDNPAGWYNLALVRSARNECNAAAAALQQALAMDGPEGTLHLTARVDPRLTNCRNEPQFQRLLAQQPGQPASGLPFTVSH
jgi:tetratricopeptide (TPR) repeat protein